MSETQIRSITVTLDDGRRYEFPSGVTVLAVLEAVDPAARKETIGATVNGRLVDLGSPIEGDAHVKWVSITSSEGLSMLRHSAAHLMAAAVQKLLPGSKFAIGPAIQDGFYYDIEPPRPLTADDLPTIEATMRELAEQRLPFVRFEVPLDEAIVKTSALEQPYKVELLESIRDRAAASAGATEQDELAHEVDPAAQQVSFYTTGDFVDLCRGPHVLDTSVIRFFRLTHLAGAYWRGDERRPMLTRIYGIAFPTQEALEAHLFLLEEAKRRDHRRLGRDLDLFSVHDEIGGGLVLWHPKGALVRKLIEDLWREQHLQRGYDLVYSPHVGRAKLWETSGHLDFYQEFMYPRMEMEGNDYYVKPMNCPFHIKLFQSKVHSYRELPVRFAELGTVYRFERAGVLHGLLRVRGFTQDDAHIFCTPEQMVGEVARAVSFSLGFLSSFGFDRFDAYIATRPEKAIGDQGLWNEATDALRRAADDAGLTYQIDDGGGAFYGPKIDLKVRDALGRAWQCTTIQFDFNLPERFDITYVGEDNRPHRPFMVHRAILGSLERFFGVLVEHHAGAFPTWLAPVQARLVPVADRFQPYARQVSERLRAIGVRTEVDVRNEKVGYKIRDAEVQKTPYILVVGEKEASASAVSVRQRGGRDLGVMPIDQFASVIQEELKPVMEPSMSASCEGGSIHQ
ncbi:MAG: threonine--tRNA ligase [Candidatus Methylomirabilota bacterium]|nr:threonine--tRNA ligase [candidate division NC10 bacterium]PWB43476.1 MAG: threonine--tRNA ligase [candidate division NC10 bacterium]